LRDELLLRAARGYTDIGRTSAAAQLHYQGFRSRGNRSCVTTQGDTTSRATNSIIPNVISTRRLGHLGWGASVRLLYSTGFKIEATRPRYLVSRLVRIVKIVKAAGFNWDAGCDLVQDIRHHPDIRHRPLTAGLPFTTGFQDTTPTIETVSVVSAAQDRSSQECTGAAPFQVPGDWRRTGPCRLLWSDGSIQDSAPTIKDR
jgi:hypothetical protein